MTRPSSSRSQSTSLLRSDPKPTMGKPARRCLADVASRHAPLRCAAHEWENAPPETSWRKGEMCGMRRRFDAIEQPAMRGHCTWWGAGPG